MGLGLLDLGALGLWLFFLLYWVSRVGDLRCSRVRVQGLGRGLQVFGVVGSSTLRRVSLVAGTFSLIDSHGVYKLYTSATHFLFLIS